MLDVAEGQLRETEHAGSLELSAGAYERIARRKTAALFELAARIGAYLAGRPPAELDALRRFGADLGVAFQLLDDLDDFAAQPVAHRSPATDLRERVELVLAAKDVSDAELLKATEARVQAEAQTAAAEAKYAEAWAAHMAAQTAAATRRRRPPSRPTRRSRSPTTRRRPTATTGA